MQRNVRAPKGFFGMRGKKDYDMQVQEKRALLGVQQVRYSNWTKYIWLNFSFHRTWMVFVSAADSSSQSLMRATVIHHTFRNVHQLKHSSACEARNSVTTTLEEEAPTTSEHRWASWECAARRVVGPTHFPTNQSMIHRCSTTTTTASMTSERRAALWECEAKKCSAKRNRRLIWCSANLTDKLIKNSQLTPSQLNTQPSLIST